MNQKRKKFVDLAESRTKNAIKAIRTVGKLSNKNSYEFTDADVTKITRALMHEIDDMKRKFKSQGGKEDIDFKL